MKKYILILCIFSGAFSSIYSQELGYGFRGGINYPLGGHITGNDLAGSGYWTGTAEAEGNVGFQGGIFLQVNFGKLFIRPELVYSTIETEFDIPIKAETSTYSIERFAVPLMLGYNVYGPIDVYLGPVYSNILDAKIEGEQNSQLIEVQDSPINAQIGAKIEFGRFGIDVRYEHSLSTPGPQTINFDNSLYGGPIGGANEADFDDATINQIIVSVILKIGGPGLNEGRGRPCY